MIISDNLLKLREENEKTQQQIAEILGVSQQNYSRWETSEKIIPLIKINDICNYYHITMDYLIGQSLINNYIEDSYIIDKHLCGRRLHSFRKKFNLSQTQLALFLNTSHSTISAYEHGKTLILTSFAFQIVKEYNISLDWLCGRK